MNKEELLAFLSTAEAEPLFEQAEEAEFAKLKKKVIRICSYSEQSSIKLRERLIRDGFDLDDIDRVIEYAKQVYLLDDRRYAELLVASLAAKAYGQDEIKRRLSQLDIEPESLDAWTECFAPSDDLTPEDQEIKRALQYLIQHPSRSKRPYEASIDKLRRRGFNAYIARKATTQWMSMQERE